MKRSIALVALSLVTLSACDFSNPAQDEAGEQSGSICEWGDSIFDQAYGRLGHVTYFREAAFSVQVGAILSGYGFKDYTDHFKGRIAVIRGGEKGGNCAGHIVELGTNDVGTERTQEEFLALITPLLDDLGDVPIVFVAPNRFSSKGTQASRDAFELALEQYAGEHTNVHVYKLYEDLTPEDYNNDAQVHLSSPGVTHFADYVEDRLDEVWPSDPDLNTEPEG